MRTGANITYDEVLNSLQQTWEQSVTSFDAEVIDQLFESFVSDSYDDQMEVIEAVYEDLPRMSNKVAMYLRDTIDDILDYYGL